MAPHRPAQPLLVRRNEAARGPSLPGYPQRIVGQQNLTGLALGAFNRITYSLSANLAAALAGDYSDLRFRIVLNVPPSQNSYLLDRLWLGQSTPTPDPGEDGGVNLEEVAVQLPPTVGMSQVLLAANGSLMLADRVTTKQGYAFAAVSNMGTGPRELGVAGHVGNAWARGPVTLRDRAFVHGSLLTGATLLPGSGSAVLGGLVEGANLLPASTVTWTVEFPTSSAGDVSLEPDQQRAIVPGAYGQLNVKSRSTVHMPPGTYYFQSLNLEPDAALDLYTALGSIVVYVRSSFTYKGGVFGHGHPERVLFVYLGTADASLDSAFTGTLIAPRALVTLPSRHHRGAFYGRDLLVRPEASFDFIPFAALQPGECTGKADGAACDDDDPCTIDDRCLAGDCHSGTPLDCPLPDNPCLDSICSSYTGRCMESSSDGQACDDGDPNTANDVCFRG